MIQEFHVPYPYPNPLSHPTMCVCLSLEIRASLLPIFHGMWNGTAKHIGKSRVQWVGARGGGSGFSLCQAPLGLATRC